MLNDSIAGYHNPAAEWIISVFMVIFGVNFNLYFFLLLRRYKEVLKNEELRMYLILCMDGQNRCRLCIRGLCMGDFLCCGGYRFIYF